MPTSTEFIRLCRTQIALVSSWGACLSIVYLTEKLVEGGKAKLIPIVAYPEKLEDREATSVLKKTSEIQTLGDIPKLSATTLTTGTNTWLLEGSTDTTEQDHKWPESHPWQQRQIVLPLIHDGVVMGLLVTAREDRPWNQREKTQIQQVAHTIAIACILDRRSQWLKEQFQQQQQLQAQQYDIIHDVLHQLKSPLTALRTFGKLLLKRFLPEDKNWNIANSILREGDRLRELIEQIDETVGVGEEILSISGESEYLQTTTENDNVIDYYTEVNKEFKSLPLLPESNFLESVSVQDVLEPLLVSAKAIADERYIDLEVDFSDNLPIVKANNKALREVLSNIIDNALKYTPAGGNIYIKLTTSAPQTDDSQSVKNEREGMLAIAISDTGYGIPKQDLEHLFERNYRGEKAKTDIPGTGLGLAIALDLIHAMKGKIQVYSPLVPHWLSYDLQQQDAIINSGTTVVLWLQVLN
ncbi:GAF domain-containing sensor histidine kinase [Okeania sp. KiyG1]|uniref:GAF domain-containing sensor histidine kinase n=1 Tax=Okeania sp. KiyG1 TaxID=2720165 RepID=UPI0019C72B46|nr:GAF domain-containing sensor histidine kinase [Okeania sp. KiyG1]GGA44659.1 sensor histidine kinase [Okeania sp. KiyG1]